MTDAGTVRAGPNSGPDDGGPRRRRRFRFVWAAALLFAIGAGLGFVAGGATATWAIYREAMEALEHPERAPARITDHLRDRLELDETQAERIEALLRQRMERIRGWVESPVVQWMIERQLDHLAQDIRAVLREPQKPEWDRIYQEVRRRVLVDVRREAAEPSRAEQGGPPPPSSGDETGIGETG
jgi:hypothetical protein